MYEPAVTEKSPVPLYGVVPPVALTVTVAEPPLQEMVVAEEEAVSWSGCVTVTEVEEVHPRKSVTV